jgi:hypothetical protein
MKLTAIGSTELKDEARRYSNRHQRRFRECYEIAANGCWIWKRQKTSSGFPRFNAGIHSMLAHELSFRLANGFLPANELIEQTCGDKLCVNPEHLRASGRAKFHDCGRRIKY